MLRNYQIEIKNKFQKSEFDKNVITMPTGSGKTYTFIEIAKDHFAETTERVLILVHRTELLTQAKNSLGESCFEITAGIKSIPHNYNYYIAMVETTSRRMPMLPEFGLCIVDECHYSNFKKVIDKLDCKILGVTATPISEHPLSLQYDNLILGPTVRELIGMGSLVDCDVFGFASDLVGSQKFKVVRGEFDEKQMQDFYSSEKMVKNVIQAYWDHSAGKKTLIFNVNISHNLAVYSALVNEGIEVGLITGETPKNERKEILEWFKSYKHAVLCNVGVLTTGFDEPSIETIILNRATKSLGLYLQMVGRGARPSEGKYKFKVLDLGKNTVRHGAYSDDVDWMTYFKQGAKKKNEGTAPVKECPECHILQHTRKALCENCGHSFEDERRKQEEEEKEQKLIQLFAKSPIKVPTDRIYEMAKERGWKEWAVLHKIADHLVSYFKKHENNITFDIIENEMANEVATWCKTYEKKNNYWIQELSKKILNEKRRAEITG